MEIKKTARLVRDFYGGLPAIGAVEILRRWVEDKQDKALLSFADQIKKKGETALDALASIMSVLHRDSDGNPIIEAYMLKRCLVETGQTIFNAMKDKTHPKKDIIPMAIPLISPLCMNFYRGDTIITEPDGVQTYTVSIKRGNRSFFKAYEYIRAGATFEVTIEFDEDLLNEVHIDMLLKKAGLVGTGSFRERFGKFEWI